MADRRLAPRRVQAAVARYVSRSPYWPVLRTVSDCRLVNFPIPDGLVPVSIAPSKGAHVAKESRRYLHLLIHRCLPFSPFMCIFRRCCCSRPLTASGRCVSRNRIHGYVHTLISEKNPPSEGWFIQSWPSPEAVAIGCTRLTSSGAVEGCQLPPQGQSPGKRCLGEVFISQRYCDPYRTPRHPSSLFLPPPLTFRFLGYDLTLTHLLPWPTLARHRVRNPEIIYSGQDVLRTTLCEHVVLGAHIASALWLRRCWRAAGCEQPMHPGDRSRWRRLVRPFFTPLSVDADFLLLLWDIYFRPRFGELFGRI